MSAPQSPTWGHSTFRGASTFALRTICWRAPCSIGYRGEATGNVSTKQLWDTRATGVPSAVANETGVLDAQGSFQIAGYKYVSYSAATAQLVVVLSSPKGALLAIQMPMQWLGDDWKFVYPASGGPVMQALPQDSERSLRSVE